MKWISDKTGRFPQRPFYEAQEIDCRCENIITSYLNEKYGRVEYPISTNDLTILIEQKTSELDLYSDLSTEGPDVEGMTIFSHQGLPRVQISNSLSISSSHINRFRTTLTHEFGHVILHNAILALQQPSLFSSDTKDLTIKCNRDSILNAREVDWLEWQAGYASGALLMPLSSISASIRRIKQETQTYGQAFVASDLGIKMVKDVQLTFQVSEAAARIRLLKLGFIYEGRVIDKSIPMFS